MARLLVRLWLQGAVRGAARTAAQTKLSGVTKHEIDKHSEITQSCTLRIVIATAESGRKI